MRTASTRVCGVAVGLLSAGLLGAATPVAAQTLEQALIAAYTYNPTLLAQRARLRSTDEQVPQALSNWRPDIELVTSVGAEVNQADTRTDPLINQRRDPKSLAITLTQPLFRGGRTLAATSGAENTVKAERARLEATEQQLLLDTVTAFMDVYLDRAVLELNLSNEQVLQRQLEATQDRFQVGEITRTDVHQAEARLSRSTADRIQSEGNLESSIATYRNLTSESPPDVLVLPEIPEDLPTAKDEALDLAAVNNPDLVAAQFDQRAALDGVDEVWGELLPVLEFSTSASRNLNSLAEESKQTTYEALVTLTVPIYQTGSVYSRLRAAKQTVAERLQRVDVERRNAVELATRSWENLQTATARVVSFETQITANEIAFEGVEREAGVGSRTVLDVLDAEQELLDSRVNHVRAQRDRLVAAFEVKSAIGALTIRALGLPVDYYDPTKHYEEVRWKVFGGRSSGTVD